MAAARRRTIAWVLYLVAASFICLVTWLFKLWPVQAPFYAFRQYPPCPVLVGIMQGRGSVIPLQQAVSELLIVSMEVLGISSIRDYVKSYGPGQHQGEQEPLDLLPLDELKHGHKGKDRE